MKTEYTPEMITELIRCQNDPVYFINNYCYLNDPFKGKVPFKLYDFQEAAIRALYEQRFSVMMQGRQTGKTSIWQPLLTGSPDSIMISTLFSDVSTTQLQLRSSTKHASSMRIFLIG
jgi:hypothetical protein